MKNSLKRFLKFRIHAKTKFNIYYFLYCLYELRYGKILLHNSGFYPSALTSENAYQFQLYLEIMAAGEVSQTQPLTVCDIGCGQGHGSVFLLQNYLHKQSHITGLDICEVAIAYAKWKYRKLENVVFKLGRQDTLKLNQSFDIILSVGSGVPHSSQLLQEIYRSLKPSGLFLFYEVYETAREQAFDAQLIRNGFTVVKKINVTSNLVQSLTHDNDRKQAQLAKLWFLPRKAVAFLDNYASTMNSTKFDYCQNNKSNGFIYALRKVPDFNLPELFSGHIDVWDGTFLKGWAFSKTQNQPIKLHVVAEGKVIAETVAKIAREDVKAAHGKNRLNSGFSVALPAPEKGGSYSVQVVDARTGQPIDFQPFLITAIEKAA